MKSTHIASIEKICLYGATDHGKKIRTFGRLKAYKYDCQIANFTDINNDSLEILTSTNLLESFNIYINSIYEIIGIFKFEEIDLTIEEAGSLCCLNNQLNSNLINNPNLNASNNIKSSQAYLNIFSKHQEISSSNYNQSLNNKYKNKNLNHPNNDNKIVPESNRMILKEKSNNITSLNESNPFIKADTSKRILRKNHIVIKSKKNSTDAFLNSFNVNNTMQKCLHQLSNSRIMYDISKIDNSMQCQNEINNDTNFDNSFLFSKYIEPCTTLEKVLDSSFNDVLDIYYNGAMDNNINEDPDIRIEAEVTLINDKIQLESNKNDFTLWKKETKYKKSKANIDSVIVKDDDKDENLVIVIEDEDVDACERFNIENSANNNDLNNTLLNNNGETDSTYLRNNEGNNLSLLKDISFSEWEFPKDKKSLILALNCCLYTEDIQYIDMFYKLDLLRDKYLQSLECVLK